MENDTKKNKYGEQPTFQPQQQSQKSREYSQSAKKRADPRRTDMSISDRLYEDTFDQLEKKTQLIREKEFKDNDNSYRPTISKYNTQLALNSRKSIALRSLSSDVSKWDHFYQDHKKKLSRRDVELDESLMSKNKSDYTFKPNIPKQSLKPLLDKEYGPNTARRRQSIKPSLDMGKKRRTASL